jgi:hypothetical protein
MANHGNIPAFAWKDLTKPETNLRISGVPAILSTLIEFYHYINLLGFPLLMSILPLLHSHVIAS